ncbi:MAG: FtsX-like permease family protein [Balneolaceae bacterium]|nr:FtsX-like permease family protein [Balneolaceae bacterium]
MQCTSISFLILPLDIGGHIYVIAILILVIAVINYMNLSTARAGLRAKEVGIRKASGAYRGDLFKQFMGEALANTVLVIPFCLLLVELLLPWFNQLMQLNLELSLVENISLISILVLFVTIAGLVSGFYPSVVLSSFKPVEVLKGTYSGAAGSNGFRKGLIVTQFMISCGLIMATLTITKQISYISNKNLGFDKELILTIDLGNQSDRPSGEVVKNRFLKNPHVQKAALSFSKLSSFTNMEASVIRTDNSRSSGRFRYSLIGPDFIPLMDISMITGHNFRKNVSEDLRNGVIINEKGSRILGWQHPQNAIGGQVSVIDGTVRTIIGVAQNFHIESVHQDIEPVVLFAESGNFAYPKTLNLKLQPGNIGEAIPSLQVAWEEIAPGIAFNYQFLDKSIRQLYAKEQQTYSLFLWFAALAILLGCLGLFGLATYASQRRTKEIGIRKVLGATVTNILGLISKDFLLLVLIGFVLAMPLAWYFMNQWLTDFAYRIEIGPGIFALAGGTAFAIALLTVSWQSIKAAMANPVDSLRNE